MKNIILASASPRRIEMMKEHNITPEIIPAHITENIPPNISLESVVMFLALKKAMAVREKYLNEKKDFSKGEKKDFLEEEKIIVAADTVVYQNEIMGKPKNKKEAFQMLSSLRGTCHLVATGVAIAETHTLKKKAVL